MVHSGRLVSGTFLGGLLTRLLILCAAAVAFAGCATALPSTDEYLDWSIGPFELAAKQGTGAKGCTGEETFRCVYKKLGETPETWTTKLEVTDLPIAITLLSGEVRWNPESVMNAEKAHLRKRGCSTDTWTVLQKDQTSMLWEWRNISCPGYLHQHELGRIVMGNWHLWIISYGMRNRALSEHERGELIANLLRARVAARVPQPGAGLPGCNGEPCKGRRGGNPTAVFEVVATTLGAADSPTSG
jgi:hypothetical protein